MMTLSLFSALLTISALLSAIMTGLIWTMQLVHYPMFSAVGHANFPKYHAEHTHRISWLVLPLMTAELISAGLLVWVAPGGISRLLGAIGLTLVVGIWCSTALIQARQHTNLDPSKPSIDALVRWNWIRTWCWTLRTLLLGGWLWVALGPL